MGANGLVLGYPFPMQDNSFSVLAPLFSDPEISEIMVNRYDRVFVEKKGKLESTSISFGSREALNHAVNSFASAKGIPLNTENPYTDTNLEDGSRLNITIAPMAVDGPFLTIRKFAPRAYTLSDLVNLGTLSVRAKTFLEYAILSRASLIVSGGTSSGKTTLLNALAQEIPASERIITIEDTPELRLPHQNWIRLEAVHSFQGEKISVRDCLVTALRMRPDRIIVGECRKKETFEMLQAMNTGHRGSLTTVHANSPRDCISRLESLVLSHVDFPAPALRRQIASALDFIIQVRRDQSGERMISEIAEVQGMQEDVVTLQPIFRTNSFDELELTGLVPKFLTEMLNQGIPIPKNFFDTSR